MTTKTLILATLLVASVACDRQVSPTNPEAPVVPVSPVSTLRITASPAGNGYQLTATLAHSDGALADVTSSTTWESSAPDVATISGSGVVEILKDGDFEALGRFETLTGSLSLRVSRTRYSVSGRVTSTYPTMTYVRNARIDIVAGPNQGASTTTDDLGYYQLDGLVGGLMDISASALGYSTWSMSGVVLTANQTVDPVLTPVSGSIIRR